MYCINFVFLDLRNNLIFNIIFGEIIIIFWKFLRDDYNEGLIGCLIE